MNFGNVNAKECRCLREMPEKQERLGIEGGGRYRVSRRSDDRRAGKDGQRRTIESWSSGDDDEFRHGIRDEK